MKTVKKTAKKTVKPGAFCSTCRYYTNVPGSEVAECRRFPPQVFHGPSSGPGYSSGFALVKPDQWCGEWWSK